MTLAFDCDACGAVHIDAARAELHVHRSAPVRLLHATCPGCGELLVSSDPALLDAAEHGGAQRRELLPVVDPLRDDDVEHLRAALEAGWPFDAAGEQG